MPAEYNIYTEEGTYITSVTADRIDFETNHIVLLESIEADSFNIKVVLPKTWAIIGVE